MPEYHKSILSDIRITYNLMKNNSLFYKDSSDEVKSEICKKCRNYIFDDSRSEKFNLRLMSIKLVESQQSVCRDHINGRTFSTYTLFDALAYKDIIFDEFLIMYLYFCQTVEITTAEHSQLPKSNGDWIKKYESNNICLIDKDTAKLIPSTEWRNYLHVDFIDNQYIPSANDTLINDIIKESSIA